MIVNAAMETNAMLPKITPTMPPIPILLPLCKGSGREVDEGVRGVPENEVSAGDV
jgi:hypothetical protein